MGPVGMSKGGKSTIKGMKALIEQFCAVTGSDEDIARRMIETCNGNIEMAVNMHMESQSDPVEVEPCPALSSSTPANPSENVRAPIPQTKGILVDESYSYGFRGRRRATNSVFDGFRDFQAETRRQEEELVNGPSISSKKRKTLEDLFRPPLDIIHKGSFESAKDAGRLSNRWLMVNIQNSQEFACQILNRDLWSNTIVKNIIREHFVFWQVYHDSEEGLRFSQFYKADEFPYVAVLDPRTGEKLVVWNKVNDSTIFDLVAEFLKNHPNFSGNSSSPPTKKIRHQSILDASEDSQLEAALAASLQDNNAHEEEEVQLSSGDDIETFDSDEEIDVVSKNDSEPPVEDIPKQELAWQYYMGDKDDPECRLILRYPSGQRGDLTLPSSSKLKAVVLFAQSEGFANEEYDLVTNFPKRNISNEDPAKTLEDIGLQRQETIFVQLKNPSAEDESHNDSR